MSFFANGAVIFGHMGLVGQRGPPLEDVDHFDRKISMGTKAFHLFLNRNFQNFWHN